MIEYVLTGSQSAHGRWPLWTGGCQR